MTESYFGTDGIRGTANSHPMTAECALRIGMAAGNRFHRDDANKHRVVIGKDTRRSCYMIENALTAGLTATGMNVHLLGPVPTPAVGLLTRSMRADLGVMITASHNPHNDNGIKFFGPDGYKLTRRTEAEIETLLRKGPELVPPRAIGRAMRVSGGQSRYVEYAKTTLPRHLRMDGLRIVVDCANGAGYRVAPDVLWELGADVIPVGVEPDGYNINENCGSTDPQAAIDRVKETRADIGICLDGDADRVLIIDETGRVACGDQILALLAKHMAEADELTDNTVVMTVMSNLGLERMLNDHGIKTLRTSVGDRHIVEMMQEHGYVLGGEQSGHIIMAEHSTTGDGLIAALQFIRVMVETGGRASEIADQFEPVPQIVRNLHVEAGAVALASPSVKACIADMANKLGRRGRVLVRQSGTEPLIRVMVEGNDTDEIRSISEVICQSVKRNAYEDIETAA
ncbi:MAG: phosphoglucosamine mutase [Rhodobacteraceae bacterium]|nr:phosphoglucosamine mutase [Paracoccaceae bacterium]